MEKTYQIMEEIKAERIRQINGEGFDDKHDIFNHPKHELALAAICYAAPEPIFIHRNTTQIHTFQDPWPWHIKWDKRNIHPTRKRLVIAAALIAAEIERLDQETNS